MEEKNYWVTRKSSSVLVGIYAIQTTPRDFWHYYNHATPQDIHVSYRERIDRNIKSLSKLSNIQANCLGLLARPRELFDPLTSTADLNSYLANIREPLERYIHDEISLLEDVCGSLMDMHLPSRTLSEDFDAPLFVHIAASRLQIVANRVDFSKSQFNGTFAKHTRPGLMEVYWLPITATAISLLWIHKTSTIPALVGQVQDGISNALETVQSFFRQWIITPCLDILKTIRHKESKLAIMGSRSLISDLEVIDLFCILTH